MNYDDAKIRQMLLKALPDLQAPYLEMEEFDYGDRLGVTYLMGGKRLRCSVNVVGKKEEVIARELLALARETFGIQRKPGRPTAMETKLIHAS